MKGWATVTVFAFMLAISHRAAAQVQLGNLKMNLSGNVAGGYTADFGNSVASDHGFTAASTLTLQGSYYDPNFLSFTVTPFLNQSWANSDTQSILNSSGVTATASIFSGSNTPGTVSYSRIYNSTGTFGVPGVANYTSYGNSNSFSVGWTEHLANRPVVTVGYQQGSNDFSLLGTSSDITSTYHGVNASVSDTIAGFNLNGSYHYLDSMVSLPEILGQQAENSSSISNTFSLGVGHSLPFNGTFSAQASRSDFNTDYNGGSYNGTIDTAGAGVGFNLTQTLNLGANALYNDNLLGSIYQPIIAGGGVIPERISSQSSHILDITGYANYRIPAWHVTLGVTDDHRNETVFGEGFASNVVTGTATYSNDFKGGFLNATEGMSYSSISPGGGRLGFLSSLDYTRAVGHWFVALRGAYTQDAQTLLITYTTNTYGYSASVSRKFRNTSRWTTLAAGSKTDLLGVGTGAFTQTFATAVSLRRFAASASYTRSSGNGILTATGVTNVTPLLPVLTPTGIILYGGHTFSASVSANPIRGFTASAVFSKSLSDTSGDVASSTNRNETWNVRVQYLIRKIYFQAGYLHLEQSFSSSGVAPINASSVYVGLQRWFDFF